MDSYRAAFAVFFGATADRDFKVRNHVDLLLGLTSSELEKSPSGGGTASGGLRFRLLRKFRYSDSRAPMGLWLYEVVQSDRRLMSLSDTRFEEFPHAFVAPTQARRGIVNIFE